MLLPHTASYVRELALHNHVALAAFRAGKGNGNLLAELAKALYLAWYLQEAGFEAADRELYLEVEGILDNAARNSNNDIWFIEPADWQFLRGLSFERCDAGVTGRSVDGAMNCVWQRLVRTLTAPTDGQYEPSCSRSQG